MFDYFRKSIFLMSMFIGVIVFAQQKTVTGIVFADNKPLTGASIVVKGSTVGTAADFDGKFTLSVPTNVTHIIVSYIGYVSQEVLITQGEMKINLVEDQNALDEVVINVGYGSQKKSVVTGAISKIDSKELEKIPNAGRIEQSLQGQTAGVYIAANAGQPGSGSTVRVRGVTTFSDYGGNNVLWVVDGVVINDDIGFLNQSDIESIEILKDAASLAIYGARSASGVILVTTKKGKKGDIKVGYNGTFGLSSPARKLNLLNASQYANIMNEKAVNSGMSLPYSNPSSFGEGTDWQNEIFSNNAFRIIHEANISGANDISNFYLSFGSQYQEGIVFPDRSNINKQNIRLNSQHKLSKYFTIGQNLGYSHQKSVGISTNSEYGGPLISAINLDPITKIIETDPIALGNTPYNATDPNNVMYYILRDENGNPYGISNKVGQGISNPLAYKKTINGQFDSSDDFVGNAFLEFKPMEGLSVKSTLGAKLAYWGNQGFSPKFYLNPSYNSIQNSIYRTRNNLFAWNIENILTYSKVIGNHDFTLLLGQGAYEDDNPTGVSVTHLNLATNDWEQASFNSDVTTDDKIGYSWTSEPHRVSSLFTRLNYNYNEKYIFTGILRRDGSSNFGANSKYGNFPSFSLGWVVSKESFWKDNNALNSLKIRGGYGVTGNDRIRKFSYESTVSGGRNYTFGLDEVINIGVSPDAPANPDLKWEETRQTNIGFETKLFNSLSIDFDWYKKKTVGILQEVYIPGYVGSNGLPSANDGDMENTGIELEFTFKKQINDINFSFSGNFTTLKNEITYLGKGIEYKDGNAYYHTFNSITRREVGEPLNYFWGYQTDGIFQNQAEIDAYKNSTGNLVQPNAQPGDFKWVDVNGDGVISDLDKTNLGNPLPKYTFGFTINANYKQLDFTLLAAGWTGNKIFQGLRRLDIQEANYTTAILNRWTGEGSSNEVPRLDNSSVNFGKMSDYYLQDGDFLRLKVLQLGYSLPNTLSEKIKAEKIRLSVTAENILTFTKYTGYDPEIGGNVSGIDKGYYPQPKSFLFGINLQF